MCNFICCNTAMYNICATEVTSEAINITNWSNRLELDL